MDQSRKPSLLERIKDLKLKISRLKAEMGNNERILHNYMKQFGPEHHMVKFQINYQRKTSQLISQYEVDLERLLK